MEGGVALPGGSGGGGGGRGGGGRGGGGGGVGTPLICIKYRSKSPGQGAC